MFRSRLRPASQILRPASLTVVHEPLKNRYSPIPSGPYLIDNNIFIYLNHYTLPEVGQWVMGREAERKWVRAGCREVPQIAAEENEMRTETQSVDFANCDVMYLDVFPKLLRCRNRKRLRRWRVKTGTFLALGRKDALRCAREYFQDPALVLSDVTQIKIAPDAK